MVSRAMPWLWFLPHSGAGGSLFSGISALVPSLDLENNFLHTLDTPWLSDVKFGVTKLALALSVDDVGSLSGNVVPCLESVLLLLFRFGQGALSVLLAAMVGTFVFSHVFVGLFPLGFALSAGQSQPAPSLVNSVACAYSNFSQCGQDARFLSSAFVFCEPNCIPVDEVHEQNGIAFFDYPSLFKGVPAEPSAFFRAWLMSTSDVLIDDHAPYNDGFFNFLGVAAAAAFPSAVFTAAATEALWAGEATHNGKAEEKDTCKGLKLVTLQMFAPQVNVWEGSAAATVYSAMQVSQPAAAASTGAFVGVSLFSFNCALATGCASVLSYCLYSVGILVTVGCFCLLFGCSYYARGILEIVHCGGCEPHQHSRGLVLGLWIQRVACTAEMAVRARTVFFGLITLMGLIGEISHDIMGLLGIMTSGQVDLWGGNNRPHWKPLPGAAAASMVSGSCLEAAKGVQRCQTLQDSTVLPVTPACSFLVRSCPILDGTYIGLLAPS